MAEGGETDPGSLARRLNLTMPAPTPADITAGLAEALDQGDVTRAMEAPRCETSATPVAETSLRDGGLANP
jgi:hypothetical protein